MDKRDKFIELAMTMKMKKIMKNKMKYNNLLNN